MRAATSARRVSVLMAEHLSPSIRRSGGVRGNVEHFDSDVKRASWQYVENNDAPYRWAAIMP
jgi:hypothetical protein